MQWAELPPCHNSATRGTLLWEMSNDTVVQMLESPASEPSPHRRRRSTSTRSQRILLAIVVALSISAAIALCDTAPTGNQVIDAIYRSAFMTATVLAGARARRRVLLIAAALVSIGSDGWTLVPALCALALSFLLAWTDRRERVAGGAVGALIGYCAMNLAWPASPTGATIVLAATAVVPLWFSGYRVARRRTRRWIRLVVASIASVMLLGAAAGAALAATQRSTLESAASNAEAAASVVASGSTTGSASDLRGSADQFRSVADAAGSWWAAPASLVPVVAQNTRAIGAAASTGADLAGVAADLAEQVDYDALARPDGSLDVQRLASYEPMASATHLTVSEARADLEAVSSPWLLAPVQERLDEYLGHLDRAESATAIASAAAAELPSMLGADGPKRYLLLLGSPAEARDLGGHIGNWAELTITDGQMDVVEVGQPYELFGPMSQLRPTVSDDLDLPASLLEVDPTRFPQNWGSSPDLSTVARLAADLFPQARGGAPIDGVIYADPTAFAALLSVTGPVTVGDTTLSADNAVEFLTRGQYAAEIPDHVVNDLVRAGLDRLASEQLPGPTALAEAFGPAVRAGHLQFVLTEPGSSELLRKVGLDRPLVAPEGTDLVAVVNRNANPSKIDAFLERTIDYKIRWDPETGDATTRVVVTMHNGAPSDGLPVEFIGGRVGNPPGTNRTELSILSPFEATGAMLDGEPLAIGRRDDINDLQRYTVAVDIPAGASRTVVLDLSGAVSPGPEYTLTWFSQPLPNADVTRVIVEPIGTTLEGGQPSAAHALDDSRVQVLRFLAE